jgi:hypothetical protein
MDVNDNHEGREGNKCNNDGNDNNGIESYCFNDGIQDQCDCGTAQAHMSAGNGVIMAPFRAGIAYLLN